MWDARAFVSAIKGDEIKAKFPCYIRAPDGSKVQFSRANPAPAVSLFAAWAATVIRRQGWLPCTLVGIPSSKSTTADLKPCRTEVIAGLIRARLSSSVVSAENLLRFTRALPSASKEKGPRQAMVLYPQLAVIGAGVRATNYVLVDDVCTTGGHLKACAAKITADGGRVLGAICAGRTTQEEVKRIFGESSEDLAEYNPRAPFSIGNLR